MPWKVSCKAVALVLLSRVVLCVTLTSTFELKASAPGLPGREVLHVTLKEHVLFRA